MKFFHFFVILAIFTIVSCRKVHRHRSAGNMFTFLVSVTDVLGVDKVIVDECAPEVKNWEHVSETEADQNSLETELKDIEKVFEDGIKIAEKEPGPALEVVCNAHEGIEKAIAGSKRRHRRFYKKGKSTRKDAWNASDIFEKASQDFSKAADDVTKGLAHSKEVVAQWQGKKAEDIKKYMKDKLAGLFHPIYVIFDKIVPRIVKFLTEHPVLVTLRSFLNCFLKRDVLKKNAKAHKKVEKIDTFVPRLGNTDSNTHMVINLVCFIPRLKNALVVLNEGLAGPSKEIKFKSYAKFIMILLHIVTKGKIKDVTELPVDKH